MDTRLLQDIITVIKAEQQRRGELLADEDPDFANDQWLFRDMPFVNELCLMLLVTVRHQVERELVRLAARAAHDRKQISGQQYQEKVRDVREQLKHEGWKKTINARLNLNSSAGYQHMEALRLLANSYKHDSSMEPDAELLTLLKLKTGVNYAPLPESHSLQEGLAAFVDLGKDATYCDIAERFVEIANNFLADVQNRTNVSRIKWGSVSLNPNDFAR